MDFYQINKPTTAQFIEAILENTYFTVSQLRTKRNQLKVYLLDYWSTSNVFISYINVTNSGGYPIVYDGDESITEVLAESINDWNSLSEEDKEHEMELFLSYAKEL